MESECNYCGGYYYTNSHTLRWRACCEKQNDKCASESENEADRRYDAMKDREIDDAGWMPVKEEPSD